MIRILRGVIRTDREGQTLAIVAVSMVALLALLSLGIDLGMAYTARAEAQRVADSAALAGASVFLRNPTPFQVQDTADAWAREYAARNVVRNRPVDPVEDVMVWVLLEEGKVRVRVERRGLPTWFARLLGRDQLTVSARAAASVLDSGVAECLKPWAVIDLFHINGVRPPFDSIYDQNNPAHRYEANTNDASDPTGWGAQNDDLGRRMVIKAQDPNSPNVPQPGVFLPLRLPDDPNQVDCSPGGGGGAAYRNNICSCNSTPIQIDDQLPIEPGNMVGPTNQGVRDLLKLETRRLEWDEGLKAVVDRDNNNAIVTQSARIVPMILIGPDQIQKSGMQYVTVRNLSLFFVEGFEGSGNKSELVGRFFGPVRGSATHAGSTTSPDVKILRLVE
jgi:hypothetical protein